MRRSAAGGGLVLPRMWLRPPHAVRGHVVVPGSAKFVAEQLINARLIEFHPRIIHNAGHGHQVKIGAEQNQAMRDIGCAHINVDGRSAGTVTSSGSNSHMRAT